MKIASNLLIYMMLMTVSLVGFCNKNSTALIQINGTLVDIPTAFQITKTKYQLIGDNTFRVIATGKQLIFDLETTQGTKGAAMFIAPNLIRVNLELVNVRINSDVVLDNDKITSTNARGYADAPQLYLEKGIHTLKLQAAGKIQESTKLLLQYSSSVKCYNHNIMKCNIII